MLNTSENTNMEIQQDNNQSLETLKEEEFVCQDDSKINTDETFDSNNSTEPSELLPEDESTYKFTKIDKLDEDEPIPGQKYLCISFISPEGLMNCKTRGFKVRGVYGSMSEARAACKTLQKRDKYFDVFVAEVGKWCPWDPTPQQIKEEVYKDKDQNQIMKNIQAKEMKQLNEIIGRQKEKIDGSKRSHKERIANAMKQNVDSFKEQKELDKNRDQEESEKNSKIERARTMGLKAEKQSEKGKESVRERLRRTAEQNTKEKEELMLKKKINNFPPESIDEQRKKLNNESNRIIEQEKTINNLKQTNSEVDKKLEKMKEYLNKKKEQKLPNKST